MTVAVRRPLIVALVIHHLLTAAILAPVIRHLTLVQVFFYYNVRFVLNVFFLFILMYCCFIFEVSSPENSPPSQTNPSKKRLPICPNLSTALGRPKNGKPPCREVEIPVCSCHCNCRGGA